MFLAVIQNAFADMSVNHSSPQDQHQVSSSKRCCSCNGKNARCKRCKCAISGQRCTSCQPFKHNRCCNTDTCIPLSVSSSSSSPSSQSSVLSPLPPSVLNLLPFISNEFPPAPCTGSNTLQPSQLQLVQHEPQPQQLNKLFRLNRRVLLLLRRVLHNHRRQVVNLLITCQWLQQWYQSRM